MLLKVENVDSNNRKYKYDFVLLLGINVWIPDVDVI